MANLVKNYKTNLDGEDVIIRAIQFFTSDKWRVTSQSDRIVTLEGKTPIPVIHILLVFIGLFIFIVPGIILYIFLIRRMHRFLNIVITTQSLGHGTEVVFNYPKEGKKNVNRFIEQLPPLGV